ncbi:MAG: glycoside hydrolase family 2 protein [Bacteroidetes bacterium]|nr:MAG: glycoside hydrolase family 2 protein [Bacteroidota bacterium]
MKTLKTNFQQIFILILIIINFSCNNNLEHTKLITKELKTSWKFRKLSDNEWYPSTVPGTVHTDLYDNGLIPDPFYGENEQKLKWIEDETWEYQSDFELDDHIFNKNHIELNFKGLDTYAEVRLNDSLILSADNMFRSWAVECKNLLKKSGNRLSILFHSPMKLNRSKVDSLPYHLPAGNDREDKKVSVFTRKAPYHFGWDWGPRFVTAGIWQPIEIVAWNTVRISDFQIFQLDVFDNQAVLKVEMEIESVMDKIIVFKLLNKDVLIEEKEIKLIKGKNKFYHQFKIENPKLWWTNGLGEAHLYNFSIEILENGSLIDYKATRFGIRTIEVVQEPDSIGKSFYFKLNGVPVFMKGANYIPQDNFLPRVSKGKYEELILAAKKVNMNMLRVWGGGIYENKLFYDLCDENGILVWQDFMFACSMYPGDSAFLSNVKLEAIENVKRIRNHPSIALWCGNNEMQVAWERWGYQKAFGYSEADSAKIYEDYLKVFHDILPQTVNRLDSGRFYWPSSPNSAPSGWEEEAQSGDIHYWGVWWGKEPFSAYEKYVGRFMSEYGFQSLPLYSTVESFSADSDCYLVSAVMKAHNKHPIGFETIDEYMRRDYKVPEDLNNYVFVSQLLQAEGMKTAIEAHRRAMPDCMGTLYWQFNDCWPVASWSGIDYYGKWKAFHYYLRKLYAPVLVSPVYRDEKLNVHLVSDNLEDKNVTLKMTLMDFDGAVIWSLDKEVIMKANTSELIYSEELKDLLDKPRNKIGEGYDKRKIFFHVEIIENDLLQAENNLFFAKIKDLMLPKAEIQYNEVQQDGKFGIKLISNVFTKNVFIDYPDDKGNFSDNYFDLLPGEVKTVWIDLDKKEFREKVKIKSLIDRFNIPNSR